MITKGIIIPNKKAAKNIIFLLGDEGSPLLYAESIILALDTVTANEKSNANSVHL